MKFRTANNASYISTAPLPSLLHGIKSNPNVRSMHRMSPLPLRRDQWDRGYEDGWVPCDSATARTDISH